MIKIAILVELLLMNGVDLSVQTLDRFASLPTIVTKRPHNVKGVTIASLTAVLFQFNAFQRHGNARVSMPAVVNDSGYRMARNTTLLK